MWCKYKASVITRAISGSASPTAGAKKGIRPMEVMKIAMLLEITSRNFPTLPQCGKDGVAL